MKGLWLNEILYQHAPLCPWCTHICSTTPGQSKYMVGYDGAAAVAHSPVSAFGRSARARVARFKHACRDSVGDIVVMGRHRCVYLGMSATHLEALFHMSHQVFGTYSRTQLSRRMHCGPRRTPARCRNTRPATSSLTRRTPMLPSVRSASCLRTSSRY